MAAINAAGTSALIARSHRREPNALNTLPDVVAATIKTLVSTGLSRADPRLAEAGSRVALTGGPYAYVEVAFGPFVGFLSGVLLWAGLTAALAAVTSFFTDSLAALVPAFDSTTARVAAMLVVVASLTILNIRGVRDASRFNAVMTVAKLLPILLLVCAGAFAVRRENLVWQYAPSVVAVGRSSAVLIFAFLGVEAALVASPR